MENDYFVSVVLRLYKKAPTDVEEKFLEFYGVPYSEKALREQDVVSFKEFVPFVKSYILIKDSPLTLDQIKGILLASEIQSNISLQAFTEYQCNSCGEKAMWHNSAVPRLCEPCRDRAAMNVIRSGVLHQLLEEKNL